MLNQVAGAEGAEVDHLQSTYSYRYEVIIWDVHCLLSGVFSFIVDHLKTSQVSYLLACIRKDIVIIKLHSFKPLSRTLCTFPKLHKTLQSMPDGQSLPSIVPT